jgi:tRNA threonylcarbamoyl adenosine modification protein YeaZ
MTISLTIDTATSQTIVGLIKDGEVLFEKSHSGATDHGRAVAQLVSDALSTGVTPDQVVVGMGPGPFTGLRVGIAFAHSFALARGIKVIGICSLDAIDTGKSDYTVAIDARRKEIYWAKYIDGVRVDGPSVSAPSEVADFIIDLYPSPLKAVELSATDNFAEPFYLRRPDAVPTAERS